MRSRVDLARAGIEKARRDVMEKLYRRLDQKGWGAYIGPHETLGILFEEWREVADAVQADDVAWLVEELKDLAVGCVIGIASLRANLRAETKKDPQTRT